MPSATAGITPAKPAKAKRIRVYCVKCRAKRKMKNPKAITIEKWPAGDPGDMFEMPDENVPDSESIKR